MFLVVLLSSRFENTNITPDLPGRGSGGAFSAKKTEESADEHDDGGWPGIQKLEESQCIGDLEKRKHAPDSGLRKMSFLK